MFARLTTRGCICELLVVAVLSWCQVVEAQEKAQGVRQAPAAEGGKNYILRTYDVSDLIISIEDRPYSDSLLRVSPTHQGFGGGGGGMGGGGGGFFNVPGETDGVGHIPGEARSRFRFAQFGGGGGLGGGAAAGEMGSGEAGPSASVTIADLVRVITSTVAANTWAVSGGEGQIEPLGTALVVWQAEDVQERIGELLRALGTVAAEHRTVTIDARWLLLTSDELESLLVPDQKGVPQVDREQLARLTRRPGSIRGVTSCLSSQLVYVVSGTMKNIVSGWIPVVGSIESPDGDVQLAGDAAGARIHFVNQGFPGAANGRQGVGYQPIGQSLNFGALLEIRPTLTPANSEAPVMVDLKSTVTVEGEIGGDAAVKASTDGIAPTVDRVAIETLQFSTTLRMPLKKPVLVGGLTYIPSSAAEVDGAAETERAQLYLVLEVR